MNIAVHTILYGVQMETPKGGFPTLKYLDVMQHIQHRQEHIGIFPVKSPLIAFAEFSKIQRTRWAFKKLIYAWFRKKIYDSKTYANTTDLLYDDFKEDDDILHLWDWKTRKTYRFTKQDLIMYSRNKLKNNHSPKNPYTNIPLTFAQNICIYTFLGSDYVFPYYRFGGDLYVNTQFNMIQDGLIPIHEYVSDMEAEMSDAQKHILKDFVGDWENVIESKLTLAQELAMNLAKLCLISNSVEDDIALLPTRKSEKTMFRIYDLTDFENVVYWFKDWIHKNRKKYIIRRRETPAEELLNLFPTEFHMENISYFASLFPTAYA